jgi:hypothetical protein
MSYTSRNSLKNIKELPESYNIEPLDFFTIDGILGVNNVCFDNIIFDIEQMAFEDEFNKHTTDIIGLSSSLNSILDDLDTFTSEKVSEIASLSSNLVKLLDEVSVIV